MSGKGLIDFDRVRELADFPAILDHHGIPHVRGRTQFKVTCPFHENDSDPSCSINTARKLFNCFGCRAEGSVIDFAMLMEGSDNPAVGAHKIALICGFDLPRLQGGKARQAAKFGEEVDRGRRAAEEVLDAMERPVRGHRKPQDARKGSETTEDASAPGDGSTGPPVGSHEPAAVNQLLTFQLKLDPDHPYRLERGAWLTPDVVQELGLGFCSRGMMKGRWCIPIHDERGELVAYAGRWVGSDDEIPEGKGKYELPPRERFDRSLVLFNLHRAIELGGDHALVVEGFFGALRVHVALGRPVVATMGNSISDAQLDLLKRHFSLVTLLYDGGENGRVAADRAALRLCRTGLFSTIADLPDSEQPDTAAVPLLREILSSTPARGRMEDSP